MKSETVNAPPLWLGRGYLEILDEPMIRIGNVLDVQISYPPVEVFANGGRVWLAECAGCTIWASFRTPEDVDKLIAEMEAAKRQAWPEAKANATQ